MILSSSSSASTCLYTAVSRPVILFYIPLCFHLLSLLVSVLASISVGPKTAHEEKEHLLPVSLSLTPPLFLSRSPNPSSLRCSSSFFPPLCPPSVELLSSSFPLLYPFLFVAALPWVQVVEDDVSLWLLRGCRRFLRQSSSGVSDCWMWW